MQRSVVLFATLLLGASLCACGHPSATATASPGAGAHPIESASVGRGRSVYAESCATCHGAAGGGGQIGPPLRGEHVRRTHAYIVDAIENPTPPMPKLVPAQLSQQDLLDVSAFVEQL